MATQTLCGFETGDSSESDSTAGTFSIQGTTTRGAWSAYALRTNPTNTGTGSLRLRTRSTTGNFTNMNVATLYTSFYIRIDTLPAASDEEFFVVLDTGST